MAPKSFRRTWFLPICLRPIHLTLVLGSALLSHLGLAADTGAAVVDKIGTQRITGSYPEGFRALPDGGITFVSYGADGNGRLQHILDAGEYVDKPLPQFNYTTRPIAWSDKYIVADSASFYLVANRLTGERVNRRKFSEFSAGEQLMQFDGQELVVAVRESQGGTAFRRIAIPDLKVTERIDIPFSGVFLKYGDKLVGLGHFFEASYRGTPSIVLVNKDLQIEKQAVIDPNKPRGNSGCAFNATALYDNYLVYGADCGGIRVFDLNSMQEVARRERIGESHFYAFARNSNRIAAVNPSATQGGLEGFLFEFPSLKPISSFRLDGSQVVASGDRFYTFFEQKGPRPPYVFDLVAYRIASATSQVSAIESAFSLATSEWRKGTTYSAIETYESVVPQLMPQDVQALSKFERQAAVWYAGLLATTTWRHKNGIDLLAALAKLEGSDGRVDKLIDAIGASDREMQSTDLTQQSAFMRATISVTGGALPGALAWTDRYLVIARWCGTTKDATARMRPGEIEHKIISSVDGIKEALDLCRRGYPGIAVHDARDFAFLRYIAMVSSDSVVQENVGSVTIIDGTAYAAIERRYPEKNDINLIAVDLRNGSILSTRALPATPYIKSDGRRLFACDLALQESCHELDVATLAPVLDSTQKFESSNPSSPHNYQSVRNSLDNSDLVTTDKYALKSVSAGDGNSTLVLHSLKEDSRKVALVKKYQYISQGIPSADGRFAYVLATAPSVDTRQLLRINFSTGDTTQLWDGQLGDLIHFGKYFLVSNETALDVFEIQSGRFLTRWPNILDNKLKEGLIAKNDTLLLIHSASENESLTPSRVIDLQALGIASEQRGRRSRELRNNIETSLREFVPPTQP